MLQDIPTPTLREASSCVLETERLMLRRPTLADVKAIAHLANDRRIAENTRRLPHRVPGGPLERQVTLTGIISRGDCRRPLDSRSVSLQVACLSPDAAAQPRRQSTPHGLPLMVLHALGKSTAKIPEGDIRVAEARMRKCLERLSDD